mgnify:CR=1 FL=1
MLDRIGHDGMGRQFPDSATKTEAFALYTSATAKALKADCPACDSEVIDWLRSFRGLPPLHRAVSHSRFRQRIAICRGTAEDGSDACEHLAWPGLNCGKCLCFIDIKARLRKSKCPIGKW